MVVTPTKYFFFTFVLHKNANPGYKIEIVVPDKSDELNT